MAQKKDKILPIKVWLDEESCWNNQPQYSKGYVEYVREDYHAQAILHVLQKGKEFGKKEMLENVLEWLDNNLCCYIGAQNFTIEHDRLNKDLRKDMEE